MDLLKLVEDINVNILGEENINILDIENDSRKIKKGDLFVAIDGQNTKGINFLRSAIENGAVSCMLDKEYFLDIKDMIEEDEFFGKITYIFSERLLRDMAIVSKQLFGNPAKNMKVIGVTGTKGKTTVASLVAEVLKKYGNVILLGSNGVYINDEQIFCNGRTTLESFENQKMLKKAEEENVKYAVIEISSQAMIKDRVYGIDFLETTFTNFTEDHISEFEHPDMESYFEAKTNALNLANINIINIDDENVKRELEILKENTFVTYGKSEDANIVFYEESLIKGSKWKVDIEIKKGPYNEKYIGKYTLVNKIPGMHSIYNSLAIIANLLMLDIDMEDILSVLANATVEGRLEIQDNPLNLNIYIDFAHTADSFLKILTTAREMTSGRVMVLWGADGNRDRAKRPKMAEVAERLADVNIMCPGDFHGEETFDTIIEDMLKGLKNKTDEKNIVFDDRELAIKEAIRMMNEDDVLLLLGKESDRGIKTKNGWDDDFNERAIIKRETNAYKLELDKNKK